jgi:hypothetical protein
MFRLTPQQSCAYTRLHCCGDSLRCRPEEEIGGEKSVIVHGRTEREPAVDARSRHQAKESL